jgi:hypothetical protein
VGTTCQKISNRFSGSPNHYSNVAAASNISDPNKIQASHQITDLRSTGHNSCRLCTCAAGSAHGRQRIPYFACFVLFDCGGRLRREATRRRASCWNTTGGGDGIERATALLCARRGDRVAILDKNGETAKEAPETAYGTRHLHLFARIRVSMIQQICQPSRLVDKNENLYYAV